MKKDRERKREKTLIALHGTYRAKYRPMRVLGFIKLQMYFAVNYRTRKNQSSMFNDKSRAFCSDSRDTFDVKRVRTSVRLTSSRVAVLHCRYCYVTQTKLEQLKLSSIVRRDVA